MAQGSQGGRTLQILIAFAVLILIFVMPIFNRERTPTPINTLAKPINLQTLQTTIAEALHDAELLGYVDEGEKVHAIKRLRELTGAGLKESKDAIDQLARERNTNA